MINRKGIQLILLCCLIILCFCKPVNNMNPLLEKFDTAFEAIPFDKIQNEHFLPAFKEAIQLGKKEIETIKENLEPASFENTIVALENSGEKVSAISKVFFNLNSAETNDELQKIAREVSPLLTEYGNDILLDQDLFIKVDAVYRQKHSLNLNTEDETLLENTYKSFVRNGAGFSDDKKLAIREIDKKLSQLSLRFGENVLKETNAYVLEVKDEARLKGIPETALETAAETAKEKGKEGSWVFTLHFPSYLPVITYADDRRLREEIYFAYASRAFQNNEYDNRQIVKEIAQLRLERANLLGYATHADFVLEERMAQSSDKVYGFLSELLSYAKPVAQRELEELTAYARTLGGPQKLERWDIAYYSEKLKKEKYAIDDELLKPYFKLESVIGGVFQVAKKLYGLEFKENKSIPVYHPDVKTYEVLDEDGAHLGVFYADFFPRPGKRNGAWMTSYRNQQKVGGSDQRPHISIVCNFTKPTSSKPSLLTFNEVTTLFHEFGHGLHGLLANSTYASISGTNVFWDFVELPSQVLENWTYEKECLDMFAKHYQTGELIPEELVNKIKESANFMGGYATVRQIGLASLDMAWHTLNGKVPDAVDNFENEVLQPTDLVKSPQGTNVSCAFSHIFQGGYSSGYYSYKWAEVLDADAFEFFQETGIFNKETASLFRKHVLSAGGSEHPMVLYKRFRGKEPSPKALLKRTGLLQE
jgi:peptidyl-dipeptidase Dcp